jgi:copper(I)-binding protein
VHPDGSRDHPAAARRELGRKDIRPVRRIQRIRPTGAAAAVGLAIGAMVLAGCGAGQVTQTDTQVSGIDGANFNAGPIAVRNAQFVLPSDVQGAAAFTSGGSAPLQMTIVNTGGTSDTLVSASSPIATSVQIQGTKDIQAGRTLNVEGVGAVSSSSSSSTSASATASASGTATPSATASASSSASAAATPLPTAPGSSTANVVLTGLKGNIQSGQTYDVTLTFQRAGNVTIPVPVSVSAEPRKSDH